LVSVVIPAYNRSTLLIEAVNSVLAQSYSAHEVVIVDDGSTDGTREAVAARFGANPKVRYFRQENAGVSAARNRGLREAAGEFIALLDSDDAWLPGKLEAQLAVLRLWPEAGMVWTDMRAVDDDGKVLHSKYLRIMYHAYRFFPGPGDLFAKEARLVDVWKPVQSFPEDARAFAGNIFGPMVLGNLVHTSTVLLRRSRREQAGFFDESYRTGEDYKFHLHTCRAGPVAFIDAATVLYRVGRADALSSAKNLLPIARNYLETLETALREDRAAITLPAEVVSRCLAETYAWVGSEYLADGQKSRGREFLLKSLRTQPTSGTFALLAKSFVPEFVARAYRARRRAKRAESACP
jgi:glycosyltransferase involved in cell wall biosynthesis